VGVMCAITTVSVFFLFTAISTENIGYSAIVTDKDGKVVEQYTYYEKDGADDKCEDYEGKGYVVNKTNIRSQLKGTSNVVCCVLSEIVSLGILYVFVYNKIFAIGNSDINLVNFKHKNEDKLKGLKIGLFASIPAFLSYIALVVVWALGKKATISYYTIANMPYFQIFRGIYGNAKYINDLSAVKVILMFLPLLILPVFAYISYILGYKDIFILQKLIYKNKKNGVHK